MAKTFPNHKLTAIFYADVAGYSRLTSQNEMETHKRVMETLDYASESIKEVQGTVLRYADDAILAEFTSVLKLVQTAVDIQREIASRNVEFSADDKVQIRIGLNIGEVLQDRGEIYGDGVNLAARLEAAAKPGGICISAAVHEQIVGKLEIEFADGGMEAFKNITNPVHVYHWGPGIETTNIPRTINTPAKSSIAVLAFENMSGDPDQDYFCNGITEDIITALSRISGLLVVARNSTMAYKGQAIDVKEVAHEQGVRYVLEGSVCKGGNRIRITAQLIDATTGHHLWEDRYDRDLTDIFAVQDEITHMITVETQVKVTEGEHPDYGLMARMM